MNRLMRLPVGAWLLLIVLLLASRYVLAEPYKDQAGANDVETYLLELHDVDRDRDVPVRVYQPSDPESARPVVLVSHGLGGSREGLAYLGNHWASHGYICIHMQHVGSDDGVWQDVPIRERLQAMRHATRDPQNAINRALDVTFVIDELVRMQEDESSRLHELMDLERIGIAGHSFGSWTTMAAGGMTVGGNRGRQYSDERVRCMIPLSPPVVSSERLYEATYSTLNIPALFMTGTLDTSAINDTTAAERLIPYRNMPGVSDSGAPKYQINFDGADHMTFAGESRRTRLRRDADPDTDPLFHSLILQSTTAFLDTYLLQDEAARTWLSGGAFAQTIGDSGSVEMDAQ